MNNPTELKGFLLLIEQMVGRGELQDAYRLLRNFVSKLPPESSAPESGPDFLEGRFWDNEEFFKFVEDNRESLHDSLEWVDMPAVKAFYWLAYIAYEWHDFHQALRHIDEGIARDPSRPQMFCEKGVILNGLLRFEEALSAYRQALTARPWLSDKEKARAYRGLGYALIELRRLDEAEQAFHESLGLDPDSENARHELQYVRDVRQAMQMYGGEGAGASAEDAGAAAARAFAEAERLVGSVPEAEWRGYAGSEPRDVGPGEPLGRALTLYEEALRLWRTVGDLAEQARTLYAMGRLSAMLWDVGKVLDYYHEAQSLWHQAGGHEAEEAVALFKLGQFTLGVGRSDQTLTREALGYLRDSLRLTRKIGELEGQVAVLKLMAEAHQAQGEFHKAIGFYEQMLAPELTSANEALESEALLHIAKNYERLQEFDFALSFYARVLSRAQGRGDKELEAIVLYNVGSVHQLLGNYEEAVRHVSDALAVAEGAGHRQLVGMSLNGLAVAHYSSGDARKALHFYSLSLDLRRKLKDRRGEVATLRNMSMIYVETQEWDKARECFDKCLEISRAEKDRAGEANTLAYIGEIAFRSGRLEQARGLLESALEIQQNELKDLSGMSRTLTYLAYTCRGLGDLEGARSDIEAALQIAESLRSRVYNPEWRASVLATSGNIYEFYVDLLAESGETGAAFEASEQGRARSLLDLLAEAGADIRQAVDPTLLERERELRQAISAGEQQHARASGAGAPEAQLSRVEDALAGWRAELQLVQSQIRASSPHYAVLTQPRPPSLDEIQSLLDADTLLLEYALGHTRSHLWVVSNDAVSHHSLPPRQEIEGMARRFNELLTARNVGPAAGATTIETARRKKAVIEEADQQLPDAAMSLSRAVFKGAEAVLGAAKRLLVVADGALQYIPFAALTNPAAEDAGGRPLVADHEIVYLPSASTLAALRGMSSRPSAPRSVAIFADPVFEISDPRAGEHRPARGEAARAGAGPFAGSPSAAVIARSAEEAGFGGGKFVQLHGSRDEAEAIFSLIGEGGGLLAVGFEASRETLARHDLTQYRIIHFATHGVVNSVHPELSGIVLSMVDERGEPQNGYLRLHDIYNLRLSADLVVLSACQTALGKEVRGEGLVGLTRGFMYAGAPRVLATLWEVHDLATAKLMETFYEGVRQNRPPAAALRDAQLKLMGHKLWKAPYYWAAFVTQGEWK